MYYLVTFKDSEDKFILVDSKDDIEVSEFGLDLISKLEFNDIIISPYPILDFNDFVLRIFNPKARTDTHILGENNIHSFPQLENEVNLIKQKKSKLSRSVRDICLKQYEKICAS